MDILKRCDFTTLTIFPEDDKMPVGFKKADREKLLQNGKYKDYGTPELARDGITGKGVKVAIIDQPLNIYEYTEIAAKIKQENYFPIFSDLRFLANERSSMHGIAVASILCGQELGIAPDIDLYYFAADNLNRNAEIDPKTGMHARPTYENHIKALDKILQIKTNNE